MRATSYRLAADEFEIGWMHDPALPAEFQDQDAGRAFEKFYRDTIETL